jgi:hypothetical protein
MNSRDLDVIKKYMLSQQYTYLNSGTYGVAFKKGTTVVKVIPNNNSEAKGVNEVQEEYVKYCKTKNSVHLPKFQTPKDEIIDKLAVRMYPMELLKEIDDETADMLMFVSQAAADQISLREAWKDLNEEFSPEEFSTKNRKLINDYPQFELKFKSLFAVMKDVTRKGSQKGYEIDFMGNDYANILQRTNGVLVILDPWAY